MCLPFAEVVSAVADDIARLRPFVAVLFNGFLWHGIAGVVRQQVKEIRRRMIQFDLQGAVVYGFDAKRFNILFRAAGNGFGILHRIEDKGIFTARRRIDRTPPGIDKITCGNGGIIRPFCIVVQMESISFAVIGDFPFSLDRKSVV